MRWFSNIDIITLRELTASTHRTLCQMPQHLVPLNCNHFFSRIPFMIVLLITFYCICYHSSRFMWYFCIVTHSLTLQFSSSDLRFSRFYPLNIFLLTFLNLIIALFGLSFIFLTSEMFNFLPLKIFPFSSASISFSVYFE